MGENASIRFDGRYLLLQTSLNFQHEPELFVKSLWALLARKAKSRLFCCVQQTSEHAHPEQPKEPQWSPKCMQTHTWGTCREAGLDDYLRSSVPIKALTHCNLEILERLTLNTNVSLKTGFSVFLCTLVSNFFFLSGSSRTLTYGSEVPPESMDMRSAAWRMPIVSWEHRRSGSHNAVLSGKNSRFMWLSVCVSTAEAGYVKSTDNLSHEINHHKCLAPIHLRHIEFQEFLFNVTQLSQCDNVWKFYLYNKMYACIDYCIVDFRLTFVVIFSLFYVNVI